MEYFVLQSIIKLVKDQKPYGIQGLRDIYNNVQETLAPTTASIENGLLEWLIPNNQFNQAWISQHYSHFKILQAGEESKFVMAGMPAPLDSEPSEGGANKMPSPKPSVKVSYIALDQDTEEFKALEKVEQIKLLKADKIAELKSLGVNAPTNSKLETLDKKLEEARKGNTED